MLTKIKNNNKTRMMAAALAFLVSIIIPSAAFAEPGVSITDAQCTNTFQGSERTDFNITVDGLNVLTDDVKFEAVGDKLVCSITINNNTDDIVEVNSNSAASLSNEHISHSLTSSTGDTIDIDAFKTFIYTVEYVAPYAEAQTFNNTLEIKLTADDVVVPNTGAMTATETGGKEIINIAETIAIVFGVVALVAFVMKKSKKQVISSALLAVLVLSAAKISANALHVATVTVSNKIIVSMETLEPYADVDIDNPFYLTSNLMGIGYDEERFPYDVYAVPSTSNNIDVSSGDFVDNEVTFLIDHVDAYNQYLIDLTNNGSTDAMYVGAPVITGLTDEQKEFIQVVATYEFGTPMQRGDLIRPGEMKRVLVRVKYKDGYSGPFHTNEAISFNIEFPFVKANYSAKEVNDGAGWLNMYNRNSATVRTPDSITSYDWRRTKPIDYGPVFSNPKDDGVIVSFQSADELDLSNAVEMDSGEMTEDLSIMQDGSVVAWIELNEDGEDYDGPYNDKKFYDYYVYSKTGSVVVDNCDYLFRGSFSYTNKVDLNGFDLSRCTSAAFMLSGVGYSVDSSVQVPFVIDMGDWNGENLYYSDDMFLRAGNGNAVSAEIIFSENWNPINLTHASYMFHEFGSHAATITIDTEGWRLNNLIDASYMYADIGEYSPEGTVIVKAKNMYLPRVKNMYHTFFNVGGFARAKHVNIDAASWEYGNNVESMQGLFTNTCTGSGRYTDATCDVKFDLKTHGLTDFTDMFRCTGMMIGGEGFNFDGFDTSSATNMSGLFYEVDVKALADSGVLSKIDSTNVTSMESMFYILSNVTNAETVTLDMSSFDTSDVTNMASFLSVPGNVKNLVIDMSSFDFSRVTDLPSGPYTKLIKLPSEMDSILVYVKDQAAKDFVMANSGIEGDYGAYFSLTDSQVVIK